MSGVHVATRSQGEAFSAAASRVFRSYDEALRDSDAELVYVSTRNHEHFEWAMAALRSGRHVVVDKPATLSLAQSETLAETAARGQRVLAEATVYAWHPQFAHVRSLVATRGPITRANVLFAIPWIARPNYRYEVASGGGMLWDLGPYAVSCGRVLFGEPPETVVATKVHADGEDVDTSFSVLMTYSNGRALAGHVGMPFAYSNRLDLVGPSVSATLERAFTTAPDAPARVIEWAGAQPSVVEIPAADAFAEFFLAVRGAIAAADDTTFSEMLLADARALDRLRRAAGAIG